MLIFNSDSQRKKYENKKKVFLDKLSIIKPDNSIFLAYHGDCDGITSAIFTIQYLNARNIKKIKYASFAQFKKTEFQEIYDYSRAYDYIIFLEGYGFSDEYSDLSNKSFNIDHHPVFPQIDTYLNPREFSIEPNPANALVTHDLFKEYLPAKSERLAALASIIDYCSEQAKDIIAKARLNNLNDLWNIFLSIQYNSELTNKILEFLLNSNNPEDLLTDEFFINRGNQFRSKIDKEINSIIISEDRKIIFHRISIDPDFRIASPLATILSEKYPDKITALCEDDYSIGKSRISFRNRKVEINIGKKLNEICADFNDSDGVGHEKAASVRCPSDYAAKIIDLLESQLI